MSVGAVCAQSLFSYGMVMRTSEATGAESVENKGSFSEALSAQQKKCPYSSLAKDGVIDYNGVIFVCDYESNSLCLGDMANPQNVLKISLPSGGNLKINVNNFGELTNAVGMFSPSDLCAIMRAISQYNHCTGKLNEAEEDEVETVENAAGQTDVQDIEKEEAVETGTMSFSIALRQFEEAHKLEAQDLKEEKDWRDMPAEEWDKMIEDVDKYIDAFKEHLKEMEELQEKAAQKAILTADPGMRSMAASSAALAVKNGFVSGADSKEDTAEADPEEEDADRDKNWIRTLNTDDQAILMKAQEAQKMETKALSKFQELQLVGSTETGISSLDGIIECASYKEDENKEKTWTITNIGEDGLTCKKYQDGIVLSSWEIEYSNPEDRKSIEGFISGFKQDENLRFAGIKEFWNEFLSGNITQSSLVLTGNTWEWNQNASRK